jgi:hypothetical protein
MLSGAMEYLKAVGPGEIDTGRFEESCGIGIVVRTPTRKKMEYRAIERDAIILP